MAISIKEIENRKYDSETKETISFEYTVKGLQGPHGEEQQLRVWFERMQPDMTPNKPTYKVFTFIGLEVYQQIFEMPKSGMSLMLVVATGLTALRMTLLEEINFKEILSYTIGDIVKDM